MHARRLHRTNLVLSLFCLVLLIVHIPRTRIFPNLQSLILVNLCVTSVEVGVVGGRAPGGGGSGGGSS